MAASRRNTIATRITLEGGAEVKSQLDAIGQSGEQATRRIGRSALTASSDLKSLTAGAQSVFQSFRGGAQDAAEGGKTLEGGSKRLQFALTNLSFQVNDVATSLATGGSVARVFAQQFGQIFQAFQQGGGLGAVSAGIAGLITPMRLAAAGAIALAGALALIVSRAVSAQASARQFDVILKGTGDRTGVTGKQLEEAAQRLRDVGLSATDARDALALARREGLPADQLERVARIGANVQAVFGEGSLQEFIKAAAAGGKPLEEFARKMGLVNSLSEDVQRLLGGAAEAAEKFNQSILDANQKRNQALADEDRRSDEQIFDLTRKRGNAKQEIIYQSNQRIIEINRNADRELANLFTQRNKENAAQLKAFNAQIEEEAGRGAGAGRSLLAAIDQQTAGLASAVLGPAGRALRDLSVAWNKFLESLAGSEAITVVSQALERLVVGITKLVQGEASINTLGVAILAAIPLVFALRAAFIGLTAAMGPIGIGLVIAGLILSLVDINTAWANFTGTVNSAWAALKRIGNWLLQSFARVIYDYYIQPLTNMIAWTQALIDKVKEAANAIASLFGGGNNAPATLDLTSPTATAAFATGGMVRGSGSSTSDSILARLSNGEYVVNAFSTQRFRPLLEAINSMRGFAAGGFVDYRAAVSPQRFAAGGMATAAAGGSSPGSTVHLHMGGNSFELSGPNSTVRRLQRAVIRGQIASAGKAPGFAIR